MTYEVRANLSELLESENQIHLTVYLENRGNTEDLRQQIRASLSEAAGPLAWALNPEELKQFFHPIEALLDNATVLREFRGNIGLFRTRTSFRVLSIPVELKRSTHVASSFHVKPLLKWMQWDSEFLLLGLDASAIHLFHVTQHACRKLDSIHFPKKLAALQSKVAARRVSGPQEPGALSGSNFGWIKDWISDSASRRGLRLFVVGSAPIVDWFMRTQNYDRAVKASALPFFSESKVSEIIAKLRLLLRAETRKTLERALLTFHVANELHRVEKNIHKIAKAAVRGTVKKLIVAENREIFGRFDRKTGTVAIHPFDLDHEDDDLLDDLAQRVLMSGGEVYLAKDEEIPRGRPILAIIEGEKHQDSAQLGQAMESSKLNSRLSQRSLM